MTAGSYNITCEQGATYSQIFTWKDTGGSAVNLTGYTAAVRVRDAYTSSISIIILTTENGRIALGGAAGTITLTIAATDTELLTPGVYAYNLELYNGSVTTRLLEGSFTVTGDTTR